MVVALVIVHNPLSSAQTGAIEDVFGEWDVFPLPDNPTIEDLAFVAGSVADAVEDGKVGAVILAYPVLYLAKLLFTTLPNPHIIFVLHEEGNRWLIV